MAEGASATIRRVGAAILVIALAGPAPAQTVGLGAREVAAMLDDLAACTGAVEPLALAVAGLASDQTALPETEAGALRLEVESAPDATGRVRLATARDVDRLRALREGITGLPAADAEPLIARPHDGEAVVFVVQPERRSTSVGFRLQAIPSDGPAR